MTNRSTKPLIAPEPPAPSGVPLVVELAGSLRPEEVFRALADQPHTVFFDSAMRHERLGRFSYVAADPFDWFTCPADGSAALGPWSERLGRWCSQRVEGLPPWQGGAAGLLGYEIGQSLERVPAARWDEFGMPALAMGLYDTVVAFDHAQGRAWAVSHGFPVADPSERRRRADERLGWLLALLDRGPAERATNSERTLTRDRMAPSFKASGYGDVLSDFSHEAYLRAVERTIEHLQAGDVFQVNLSQRLITPDPGDPVALYGRLRERNPAPFGGYLDGGDWQVASASPERFLCLDGRRVETRPIKGTRPRGATPEEDDRLGAELLASEKDRAENVMIVDLLRNDLSRVCTDASVRVATLFGLEKYAHVQHLVSDVRGDLRPGCGAVDLLAVALPGGSITGAPKISAQEIIASLEPTARGAYCGSLAWVGFADAEGRQAMDSSVLIRTLTRSRGWVQAPVGGGVVVQSDPECEYEETWHKAAGLIDAVAP